MITNTHVGFKCALQVIRAGEVVSELENQENLFLDSGLARGFIVSEAGIGQWGHFGDSDAPNQRDSGTLLFTRTGNVVTVDGTFFEAADVGRLLKFDSGEEMYISAYNSATEVQTNDSGDLLTPTEGTVWYVNQTTLASPLKRASSAPSTTSFSAGVFKRIFTYDFTPQAALTTVREVGFSHQDSNADICSRVVLDAPVVLQIGDQLRLTSTLELIASPNAPAAYDPTGGASEASGAGQGQFEYANEPEAWQVIWPASVFSTNKRLLPLIGDPLPFNTYGEGRVFNSGNGMLQNSFDIVPDSVSIGANPTVWPFQRATVCKWTPARIVGTYTGFVMVRNELIAGNGSSTSKNGYGRFVWAFTNPVTKSNEQAMSVTVTERLDRNLVN